MCLVNFFFEKTFKNVRVFQSEKKPDYVINKFDHEQKT